jgi:hypothetical protein
MSMGPSLLIRTSLCPVSPTSTAPLTMEISACTVGRCMTHIAIQEALGGEAVERLEHVSDEQCQATI